MDREITLRDYGRVLWSGRWLILATTVAAALVGLILSFLTSTSYVATAQLYLGQATTVSGTPVSTPATNPATAPTALTGDNLVNQVARELGLTPGRVRRSVQLATPKAAGASVGNQPTLATITYTDGSRDLARRGANAYAQAVFAQAQRGSAQVVATYQQAVVQGNAAVSALTRQMDGYRAQLARTPTGERALALQALLFSAGQQLQVAATDLTLQKINLVKEQQYGQPQIISLAQSPSSSKSLPNRLRTVILAALIGLIVGIIITFVWRGSPAGRAARE